MPVKASTPAHGTHAQGPVLGGVVCLVRPGQKPAQYKLQKGRYQLEETSIPFNSIGESGYLF